MNELDAVAERGPGFLARLAVAIAVQRIPQNAELVARAAPIEVENAGRAAERSSCVSMRLVTPLASVISAISPSPAATASSVVSRSWSAGSGPPKRRRYFAPRASAMPRLVRAASTCWDRAASSRETMRTPVLMPTTSMPASSKRLRVSPIRPGENSASAGKVDGPAKETDLDARVAVILRHGDDLIDVVVGTADRAESE